MVTLTRYQLMGQKGGKAPKHKWTDEEREIVRRDYQGNNASAVAIAVRLSQMTGDRVTFFAVKGQVQKLGCAKILDRKRWTKGEEDRLRELVTQYSPLTISRMMKRSLNSVTLKMKHMRLSRSARDGWYTKREVCEILGVDHKWIQKRIDSGELKASYHHGHKPQAAGAGSWHIEVKDLRAFIRRSAGELNGRSVDLFQVVDILCGIERPGVEV